MMLLITISQMQVDYVHEMDATVHDFCTNSLAKPVLSQMHMIGSENNA